MSRLLACLVFVALLQGAYCRAQDFPMLHYTEEEGLPSNTVYGLYRDTKGFIWMATNKGVARFNGIKFDLFSASDGLPDNDVFFIQEDRQGRIWFGSFNGKLGFYKNDTFHNEANTPFLRLPKVMPHLRHISVEYDSSLIINFNNGSEFLTVKGDYCKLYDLKSVNNPQIADSVIFRKKVGANRYKLICPDRIVYIDTFGKILEMQPIDSRLINNNQRISACQDEELLYNDNYIYNTRLQVVKKFSIPQNDIDRLQQIYQSSEKMFYITSNGVVIDDTLRILDGQNASGMTEDIVGNYWISTLNDGIFVLKKHFAKTTVFRNLYQNLAKYAKPVNGNVYFVTDANDIFDVTEKKASYVFHGKSDTRHPNYHVDFGFDVSKGGEIYDTYDNTDLLKVDVNTGKASTIYTTVSFSIKELFVSGNCIYGRRPFDLSRIVLDKTARGARLKYVGENNYTRIYGIAEDANGDIWYSTINRVFRINSGDTTVALQPQFGNADFKFFTFSGDKLVGYTQNNQLLVCEHVHAAVVTIDTVPPMKYVWDKVCTLDSDHILVSTNGEYVLLTMSKVGGHLNVIPSTVENPFIPLHAEAFCCDGDHCVFFKNHSVTLIDNKSILEQPSPPLLSFSFLKTGKDVYLISDEMDLPFDKSKHVSIAFDVRSFNSRNIQYQYSISKSDQDNWRDIASEEINLLNPGYGDYTVKIRGRSLSSAFSVPVKFTLHILKPVWATWWAITLALLLAATLLALVVRQIVLYVLHQKGREHDREIKFLRSEYKALNALMNPHFIFNTLNNVQGLVNRNDKLAANEYIRVFADLVRQNMHNISKELIPLQKEMELVTNYLLLEKLRFKEHLNYRLNIEDGLDLTEIIVPPLLVQPLVENSIKHGILPMESQDGLIVIDIYEKAHALYIDVKDNGVGMGVKAATNLKHESFGLHNIEKRIEQLSKIQNKQIQFIVTEERDADGILSWTIARIIIPL